jgi:hypothetical protein
MGVGFIKNQRIKSYSLRKFRVQNPGFAWARRESECRSFSFCIESCSLKMHFGIHQRKTIP